MAQRVFPGLGLLCLMVAAEVAAAGSFGIAPTRIELSAGHRVDVLTVRNQDSASSLVQVSAFAWSQRDGQDEYVATPELLVAPPVFELPGQAEQIIRVALRRDPDATRELSYRVVVQEVPRAQLVGTGLNVALRLTIPVFVSPARPTYPDLEWHWQPLPDRTLRIDAVNRGTAHLQIHNLELQWEPAAEPLAVNAAKYVLPASAVSWIVVAPPGVDPQSELQVHGWSDQGAFSAQAGRPGS
jgi:fimbrial chaperone protein